MKRIALFLATNIAVLVVISVLISVLGVGRIADANGLDLGALLALSAIIGFTGAIISLLISKPMAKWQTGAHVITAARQLRGTLAVAGGGATVGPRRHQDP